jgi:hypothetical protein
MRSRRLIIGLALALLTASIAGPGSDAESPNRVGLVVALGGDDYITRCVTFNEPSITGYEVLERSNLEIVAADGIICDIEGVSGCLPDNCLCSSANYWSYWHLSDSAWTYSTVGSSTYQVEDGDVEGWSWGGGEAPPVASLDEICDSSVNPYQVFLPLALRRQGWSPNIDA